MLKVSFTKKAIRDLSNIWNYTFDYWSEQQADKYYNQILKKCNELDSKPNIGRNYNKILKTLKGVKVNKHIIFFRVLNEEQIEIARILHERMDLKNKIKEE